MARRFLSVDNCQKLLDRVIASSSGEIGARSVLRSVSGTSARAESSLSFQQCQKILTRRYGSLPRPASTGPAETSRNAPQQALNPWASIARLRSSVSVLFKAPSRFNELLPKSARHFVDALRQPTALQRAASLQLEAAWQRHRVKVAVAALVAIAYFVWRGLRRTASAFIDISDSLAATGILALSTSLSAAAAAMTYRRFFVISPAAAYRMAMLRLNSHPGVLETMGAPVVGSAARASVLTGGGLKFKGLHPKFRTRRVQMIFPLRGTERRGLVSMEAKKRGGKLELSLLAVDVPLPSALGGEQRVFVEGGPKAYARGGVLDELRRPFLAALASEEAAEADEEAEQAAEAHRTRIEAETRVPANQ